MDNWEGQANCLGSDSEAFFPSLELGAGSGGSIPNRAYDPALRICQPCEVREQCLEFALTHWEIGKWGVWGGTTPKERSTLANKPLRPSRTPGGPQAVHGTEYGYRRHRNNGEDACAPCLQAAATASAVRKAARERAS